MRYTWKQYLLFFFCKHQTGQGNELGVEILLKKSRGNCLWFIYLIIRWSWWLAIMCFNIWKQQCEELGLFEEWLGKSSPELKWKKKNQWKQDLWMSFRQRPATSWMCNLAEGEVGRQEASSGGCWVVTPCLPVPSAGRGAPFNCPECIIWVMAKAVLSTRMVVANCYEFANFTFVNGAQSPGWWTPVNNGP